MMVEHDVNIPLRPYGPYEGNRPKERAKRAAYAAMMRGNNRPNRKVPIAPVKWLDRPMPGDE